MCALGLSTRRKEPSIAERRSAIPTGSGASGQWSSDGCRKYRVWG
jgi:hypothetical protein